MTDYTLGIGGPNVMMIRDTGGWVEFWFKTGSQTWNNDQWWSWAANGTGSRQKFRLLRGGNWQFFGSVWVGYDQDVRFTIEGAGLGWGTTDFWQHIQRSTVPQPPTINSVTATSSSAITINWHLNSDGGSAIVEYQLGWGSSSNGPTNFTTITGDDDVLTGLSPGQSIYCWTRVRNGVGWSGWSNRVQVTTWQVPPPPTAPTFYNVTQVSAGVSFPFTVRAGNAPNLEKQFRYGKDPTGVVLVGTVTVDETTEYIYNLDPGQKYYFWARSRNSVGWGPWSPAYSLTLVAGARVLVGGTWQRAVPYVRVGGIWKVAEPWVKNVGVWKRTSQ